MDQEAPPYKLYTPSQIGGATFLGSPVAGAFLLYGNLRKLGDRRAPRVFLGGLALTLVMMGIGFSLPDSAHTGIFFPIIGILTMRYLATYLTGAALEKHLEAGGIVASRWAAAGTGLGFMLLVLGLLFGATYLKVTQGEQYLSSPGEEVRYADGATREDAQAVAESLKALTFFTGARHLSVLLHKSSAGYRVSFVVQDGAWDKPEIQKDFRAFGDSLSKEALHHAPVQVELLDSACDSHKIL